MNNFHNFHIIWTIMNSHWALSCENDFAQYSSVCSHERLLYHKCEKKRSNRFITTCNWPIVRDTYKTAKINFINSGSSYYIHAPWVDCRFMCHERRCYKTVRTFFFYIYKEPVERPAYLPGRGGKTHVCSETSCYVWKKSRFLMFSKYLWRYSCIMKSTGSVVYWCL